MEHVTLSSQKAPIKSCLVRSSELNDLINNVSTAFYSRFGKPPKWMVAAPGRVNLIGEHTDYNDGFVLPMAIDRYIVFAGGPATGDAFHAYSLNLQEARVFRADDPKGRKNGDWSNYLRGVVDGCRAIGLCTGPLNIALQSEVPVGGGLSSSAALEVGMATMLEAASGKQLDPKQKALIAQQAEHDYAGVPCGIMDQFASALCCENELMLLDCRSAEPTMVPFTDPDIAVLIVNSNVSHELAGGEYAKRREQCEQVAQRLAVSALRDAGLDQLEAVRSQLDDTLYRRARHVITENTRVLEAVKAFGSGNWSRAGALMVASHESLRDDFEVSCAELDLLVDLACNMGEEKGVFGSRMTGGGFGGCTVTLTHRDAVANIGAVISERYSEHTGYKPSMFVTRPARSAHILSTEVI